MKLGDVEIDLRRREVIKNGEVVSIPGLLYDLLKHFLDNSDHVVTYEELEETDIWKDSIFTPHKEGGKTLDVNMGRLRKIIEKDASNPEIIVSVRGVGWKLAPALKAKEK